MPIFISESSAADNDLNISLSDCCVLFTWCSWLRGNGILKLRVTHQFERKHERRMEIFRDLTGTRTKKNTQNVRTDSRLPGKYSTHAPILLCFVKLYFYIYMRANGRPYAHKRTHIVHAHNVCLARRHTYTHLDYSHSSLRCCSPEGDRRSTINVVKMSLTLTATTTTTTSKSNMNDTRNEYFFIISILYFFFVYFDRRTRRVWYFYFSFVLFVGIIIGRSISHFNIYSQEYVGLVVMSQAELMLARVVFILIN